MAPPEPLCIRRFGGAEGFSSGLCSPEFSHHATCALRMGCRKARETEPHFAPGVDILHDWLLIPSRSSRYGLTIMAKSEKTHIYLIFGNDDYQVAQKARAIVDGLVPPDNAVFGLETIDGAADTVAAAQECIGKAVEALQTLGFMSTQKVVWFKDVSFLTDNVVGRSESVKTKLAGLTDVIKALPEGVELIVSSPKVDKRYAFYKACKQHGVTHEYAVPERAYEAERYALNFVRGRLSEKSISMHGNVIQLFIERVGYDTSRLVSELDKLLVFLGDRKQAGEDDVMAITASSRDALIWDLSDAFGDRDLTRAIAVMRQLFFQKEHPIGMIRTLENRVRDLTIYREGLRRKWIVVSSSSRGQSAKWVGLPPEGEQLCSSVMASDPRKMHPFRAGILAKQARRFSLNALQTCREALLAAHEELVSSAAPDQLTMEVLLVKMLGTKEE